MPMDKAQLIEAFQNSPAIKLLEEADRDFLMEQIAADDAGTIGEISGILEEEKKSDGAIEAVSQQMAEETVKKLLEMDKMKILHQKEAKQAVKDEKELTELSDEINKI